MLYEVDQAVEIKARCSNREALRRKLGNWGARFLGCETQVDTFYHVSRGRLKLRQAESGNLLIGYQRPDTGGPKHCKVNLYPCKDPEALGRLLADCLGIRLVVRKEREGYLLGKVKFHLDKVEKLGLFMEIEVLGQRGVDRMEDLERICRDYMEKCGIRPEDLVEKAYADLLEAVLSLDSPDE